MGSHAELPLTFAYRVCAAKPWATPKGLPSQIPNGVAIHPVTAPVCNETKPSRATPPKTWATLWTPGRARTDTRVYNYLCPPAGKEDKSGKRRFGDHRTCLHATAPHLHSAMSAKGVGPGDKGPKFGSHTAYSQIRRPDATRIRKVRSDAALHADCAASPSKTEPKAAPLPQRPAWEQALFCPARGGSLSL